MNLADYTEMMRTRAGLRTLPVGQGLSGEVHRFLDLLGQLERDESKEKKGLLEQFGKASAELSRLRAEVEACRDEVRIMADLLATREKLTEARREIEGARVVIPEPTAKDRLKIYQEAEVLELTLAWARQHASVKFGGEGGGRCRKFDAHGELNCGDCKHFHVERDCNEATGSIPETTEYCDMGHADFESREDCDDWRTKQSEGG